MSNITVAELWRIILKCDWSDFNVARPPRKKASGEPDELAKAPYQGTCYVRVKFLSVQDQNLRLSD